MRSLLTPLVYHWHCITVYLLSCCNHRPILVLPFIYVSACAATGAARLVCWKNENLSLLTVPWATVERGACWNTTLECEREKKILSLLSHISLLLFLFCLSVSIYVFLSLPHLHKHLSLCLSFFFALLLSLTHTHTISLFLSLCMGRCRQRSRGSGGDGT